MWPLKQNLREFIDGILDDIVSDLENICPEYKAFLKFYR